MKVEQTGPHDVVRVVEGFSNEQDRLGYWGDILVMCNFVDGMMGNWRTTLKTPAAKFILEEDMKKRFLFLKEVCKNMVYETDKLHRALQAPPLDLPEEKEEVPNRLIV